MSDIGEVAREVDHQLDPLASGSLEGLIAMAKERATVNDVNVTTLLEGSSNPAAEILRKRLHNVAAMIGALQDEIAGVHGAKDTLFAIWGIGGNTNSVAFAAQNTGAEVVMASDGQVSRPRLWQRAVGDIIDDMGLAGREKGTANLVRSTLAVSGLRTVADVIAIGKDKLRSVRMGERIGEPKLVALQNIVHYEYPETDIPERANPALTSQTHDSLSQVPWLAVVNNKRLFDTAYLLHGTQISVQDLLVQSRQQLFGVHADGVSEEEFAALRQDALDYAIAFSSAKRRAVR